MKRFVDYIAEYRVSMFEASYTGNIGMMEMMKFRKIASKDELNLLMTMIASGQIKEAWKLIQKVTGTKLKGKQFSS